MNPENVREKYADIFDLPHHRSLTRRPMSLYDRAAQFAPFAALSGFDDMVVEEARLTDSEIELSQNEIEMINAIIVEIADMIESGAHPAVSVTYFKPDPHKSGGSYQTLTGIVKRVDPVSKVMTFYGSSEIEDKRTPTVDIRIERIIGIKLQIEK